MKKKQVNYILENQTKRRNVVLSFIFVIVVVTFVSLSCFLLYINKSKNQYITYDEKSNIDYKVYLKENKFFQDTYLTKGSQYIASLINYIDANFNYNISLKDRSVKYKYSYRIEEDVVVKEKGSDNNLYTSNKVLLNSDEMTSDSDTLSINENVKVDYNYYNNLIKQFINIYGLDNTESVLTISMHISTLGSCEDFEDNKQDSVISLSIPLTTKTVGIDISDNLSNQNNNIMLCKSTSNNTLFIVFGVIFLIIDLGLIVYVIRYEIKTRTAENIYEKELKKILNNYSSYIQMLGNDFDFSEYQVLKVETFTDMLEISDTIRQPILMKENKNNTGSYFVIPSVTKILYVYRLKISDIKKEIKESEDLNKN